MKGMNRSSKGKDKHCLLDFGLGVCILLELAADYFECCLDAAGSRFCVRALQSAKVADVKGTRVQLIELFALYMYYLFWFIQQQIASTTPCCPAPKVSSGHSWPELISCLSLSLPGQTVMAY